MFLSTNLKQHVMKSQITQNLKIDNCMKKCFSSIKEKVENGH